VAGLPRFPGLSQAVAVVSAQTKALAELPRTLVDLNRSILSLIDALVAARETLAALGKVAARVERVTGVLEEPILALRPGLERVARVLDDDALDMLPQTLRTINADVLPLLQGLRDTQSRVNALASAVPGASLLFARRPRHQEGTGGNGGRGESTIELVAGSVIEPGVD
jgi:ABC-type transporter Mla subunit MlaD